MSSRSHPPARPPRPGSEFLTAYEVAEELRVSKMTVYRLIHGGDLPAVRVGRGFRIHTRAVDQYVAKAAGWDSEDAS